MAAYYRGMLGEYSQLNTIPASLTVAFILSSAFLFGGITAPSVNWFGGYTLSMDHAVVLSLVTYVVGFASSETKEWSHYTAVEKVLIAAGPAALVSFHYGIGSEFITWTTNLQIIAFAITMVGWTVAVR